MLCIGHRGAMGHEPENTLLSIQKALSLGVDWIEIDVHNVENNLLVIHDRRLERTTNGTGKIGDRDFNYLRSLDAGKGQQIPTLQEVFDTVNRQAVINIELKGFKTGKLVADLIKEYVEGGWSYDDFVISSFNHYELKIARQNCQQIQIGILIYGLPLNYVNIARKLQAVAIISALDFVSKKLVKIAHKNNLKVLVYTVNEPDEIERMQQLDVDGVFTNYPERIIATKQRQ
ncbi:MAG: glycerophosphodiester phosphodiesterase [Pleurocapsa sp.]